MSTPTLDPTRPANRLSREMSPYLLQHQHNPVDWFPWGTEAFDKARTEGKPVFLSIGYSTCHWCHVMERESFENASVADLLNERFVSIKVDREERPDVDRIYMTFVQRTTGQGGWPLSVFLKPDLKPFFGGTYFPPESRHGRPGFIDLLLHISNLWQTDRHRIAGAADDLHQRLEALADRQATGTGRLSGAVLAAAAGLFKREYDPEHGGFGHAPKFPHPSQPGFLLQYGVRHGDAEAVKMVLHTCDQMARGGIRDHLGGGFARYSVDAQWLVPHFEKMLYDNALLASLYLDAFLVSGERKHADVARDILGYVLRDMTHPGGGFYSAEDADSEGKEGKFYCWTRAELAQLLTPPEFEAAARHFGVTDHGNFVDHSDPEPLRGLNVLSALSDDLTAGEITLLAQAKEKMFTARAQRVRPLRDDKVLASWNGLMLSALARAYSILGDETYLEAALKNLRFLQAHLWEPATRTLYHRWRQGQRDSVQLLPAYASLLGGVIDLYEATLEPAHLEFSLALAEALIERFADREGGGFWQSPEGSGDLILRLKEDHDGAEPSGNSMAILALLRLAAITGRDDLRAIAERGLESMADRLKRFPQALPHLLLALAFWLDEPSRVVITGDAQNLAGRSLLRAVHGVYQPGKVVLGVAGPVEAGAQLLAGSMPQGPATACVCTGTVCHPPTTDPGEVRRLIQAAQALRTG